jgi:hypothetical protein
MGIGGSRMKYGVVVIFVVVFFSLGYVVGQAVGTSYTDSEWRDVRREPIVNTILIMREMSHQKDLKALVAVRDCTIKVAATTTTITPTTSTIVKNGNTTITLPPKA